MGNPFSDESNDLLVLDTKDLADPTVISTMRKLEKAGKQQYETFVNERLVTQSRPVNDPIKRNNFPLFSHPTTRD